MVRYLLLAVVCISLTYAPAYSQEEDVDYGYGTVVEIREDSNEIVVNEYDYENNEEIEVTYCVHDDAKIDNMDSWKDIPNGTYIDVEYVAGADGKKIIKYVNVYEPEETGTETE